MIRFRHAGCRSEVIRYIGAAATTAGLGVMRSSEWRFPDGSQPRAGGLMTASCPDCGRPIAVSMFSLDAIVGPAEELRQALRQAVAA